METCEDATKDEKMPIGENLLTTRYLNRVISKLKTNRRGITSKMTPFPQQF